MPLKLVQKPKNKPDNELILYGLSQELPDIHASIFVSPYFSPEQWLCLAVIDDAVNILRNKPGSEQYLEIKEWVESERRDWVHSFCAICDLFDFDVDYMRGKLRVIKPNHNGHARRRMVRPMIVRAPMAVNA